MGIERYLEVDQKNLRYFLLKVNYGLSMRNTHKFILLKGFYLIRFILYQLLESCRYTLIPRIAKNRLRMFMLRRDYLSPPPTKEVYTRYYSIITLLGEAPKETKLPMSYYSPLNGEASLTASYYNSYPIFSIRVFLI